MRFPIDKHSVQKVERWLQELHDAGLVIWYRSGRLRYILLPKFSSHQTLSGNMKAVSDYPAPDEASIRAWEAKERAVQTTSERCIDGVCTEAKDKAKASSLSDARTVFEHWQQRLGHQDAKFTDDRKAKIVARLREGFTVERLMQAIDGCASSKHNMGENERGRRYDSIDLIFRNAGKVDEFAEMAARRPGEKPPDVHARTQRIANAQAELAAGGDPDVARARVLDDSEWQEVLKGRAA